MELRGISFVVRRLIICFLFIDCALISLCQERSKSCEVFVGSGLLTNHDQNYRDGTDNKLGFVFGAGISYDVSKSFGFKLRTAFEAKGFKASETYLLGMIDPQTHQVSNQLVTDDLDKTVNFLTITALPTIRLGRQRKTSVGIGAFYGYLKSVNQKFSRINQNGTITKANSSDKYGTTNDFGLVLNVAHRIEFCKSKFEIQLNQSYGLKQYYGEFYLSPIDYQIKSGMSSIMLSYILPWH